ncbi:MAG TPA: glycosyltransferase, partial [Chloroflexota bacterium]
REYVADGETGALVEPGDVEAMADATAGLLSDPDLRARMASAARVRSTRWRWPAWLPTIEKGLGL